MSRAKGGGRRGGEEKRSIGEEMRRGGEEDVRGLMRRGGGQEDERMRGGKGRRLHFYFPGHFIFPSFDSHTFEHIWKPFSEGFSGGSVAGE